MAHLRALRGASACFFGDSCPLSLHFHLPLKGNRQVNSSKHNISFVKRHLAWDSQPANQERVDKCWVLTKERRDVFVRLALCWSSRPSPETLTREKMWYSSLYPTRFDTRKGGGGVPLEGVRGAVPGRI